LSARAAGHVVAFVGVRWAYRELTRFRRCPCTYGAGAVMCVGWYVGRPGGVGLFDPSSGMPLSWFYGTCKIRSCAFLGSRRVRASDDDISVWQSSRSVQGYPVTVALALRVPGMPAFVRRHCQPRLSVSVGFAVPRLCMVELSRVARFEVSFAVPKTVSLPGRR